MSGDYDRLFHPPAQPDKPVDDATIAVDRDAILDAAAAVQPPPAPAGAPREPDVSSSAHLNTVRMEATGEQEVGPLSSGREPSWDPSRHGHTAPQYVPPPLPQPPASAPQWPQSPPPGHGQQQQFGSGGWPDQAQAQPRHSAQPGSGGGFAPQQYQGVDPESSGAWPSSPAGFSPAQQPGSSRAIDSMANVGARSEVQPPSQRGWRHWLYTVTRINVGPSPDEIYESELHNRIRRNTRDCYQIGVVGLKGGAGKTAVTVALGSVLAKIRGDRVLAIDADPDGGNLADRSRRQSAATISDLIGAPELSRYTDIRGFTSMNGSNLEVLASQDYSGAEREFNEEDWVDATTAVSRFYNVVLADTGAGLFQPGARGVLASISGLVIVASASIDGARQAAVTLDWLRQNGYQELVSRSCVVINHVTRGKPGVDVEDLEQQFQRHLGGGQVLVLPWDKHIALGTEIQLEQLGRTFQRRVTELAAALSDDFSRPRS